MVVDIVINNKNDVKRLNDVVCKVDEPFWVHGSNNAIMVDARSFLGLCSLIGKPCRLVAEDDCNPKLFMKVARRVGA